ncbi:hypothetical protein Hanom_Chr16g01517381 [Helianthus anomalus]
MNSNSDLMSSAKNVAGTAQSAISNQSDKIVGAAADVFDAAKQYGSGFGAAKEKKVQAPAPVADAFKAAGNLFK